MVRTHTKLDHCLSVNGSLSKPFHIIYGRWELKSTFHSVTLVIILVIKMTGIYVHVFPIVVIIKIL